MSIYLYAPVLFPSTPKLLEALQAKRLVKHDGLRFLHKGVPVEFRPKDVIICWGFHVPVVPGTITINSSCLYPNQFLLNWNYFKVVGNAGYAFLPLTELDPKEYNEGLKLLRENKNVFKNPGYNPGWPRYVPYEEFPPYGTQWMATKSHAQVTVLGGEKILGRGTVEDAAFAAAVLKLLGLDFGVVSMMRLTGQVPCVRKILTTPTLDENTLPVFAKSLQELVEKKLSEL